MSFNNTGIHNQHSTVFIQLQYRNATTENNMSLDHYANNENLMRLQTEHAGDDTKTDIKFH